jgi:hypothetical protein
MKYILVLWVCSFLNGTECMAPIEYPAVYNSWYECSRTAHKESLALMTKMGYAYVNKYKIGMKYHCGEVITY